MPRYGTIPPEPPAIRSLADCAPALQRAVLLVLERMAARGWPTKIRETLRTDARQVWLHGFGRDYDDGREIVTNAATARGGWHFFGTAVDCVHATLEDRAPAAYWDALAEEYEAAGMVAGRRWSHMRNGEGDKPHGQCGAPMRTSPTEQALELYEQGGNPAVWEAVGAL